MDLALSLNLELALFVHLQSLLHQVLLIAAVVSSPNTTAVYSTFIAVEPHYVIMPLPVVVLFPYAILWSGRQTSSILHLNSMLYN